MKIYTGTGDNKETDTIGRRVSKDDIIMECLGTLDELSSAIMMASHHVSDNIKADLLDIVVRLRELGGTLATETNTTFNSKLIQATEERIDYYESKIKPLVGFVLPGETLAGANLHLCRTIARRFERRLVSYANRTKVSASVLIYANRISDLLFVMARFAEETYV